MSNMRKYLEVTDIVVTSPTYINIQKHRYCSRKSNIRKYIKVTDSVVTCPRYLNI